MTEFSKAVASCISDWGARVAGCNGSPECIGLAATQLRECLDAAFPDSKRVKLESDKVNYMLSSVFFLANRLSKATQGLAEFDSIMDTVDSGLEDRQTDAKFQKDLDEILARYF